MPITSVSKDPESLAMTVIADFDVPVRRLWDAYLDPRLLERFWGPPDYPAVFTRHDGYVGGRSEYTMTGPDGEVLNLSWRWLAVDELKSFEVCDGDPSTESGPTRMTFVFETTPNGSRLVATTYFASVSELEQLGPAMEEGIRAAASQLDAVLGIFPDVAHVFPARR